MFCESLLWDGGGHIYGYLGPVRPTPSDLLRRPPSRCRPQSINYILVLINVNGTQLRNTVC